MRFCTSLLLLLLSGFAWVAHAQVPAKQVKISWRGQATVFPKGGQGVRVPSFTEAVFEPGQRVPAFSLRLNGYVTEIQLQNTRYEAFTSQEAAAFAAATLPTTAQFTLRHGTESRRPVTLASVPAVRRNAQTGQVEKLVSFEYTHRPDAAPARDPSTQARTTRTYAANSVLRAGTWIKIGVTASGVYKLDKSFLSSVGLPVQSLDPRRLQLYGNAMGMLPQANSADRPDDLEENAIYFADNGGSNAASFDDDEYFLFYARGPHTWELNNQRFQHKLNIYSDTTYYFLTVGSTPGRRVAPAPAVTGTSTVEIREYTDRLFHELELVNIMRSGRQWLGEGFNSTTGTQKEIAFPAISDVVPGSPLLVTSLVAAAAKPPLGTTTFSLTLNGAQLGTQSVNNLSCDPSTSQICYPEYANTTLTTFTTTAPASNTAFRIGLTYSGSTADPSATGYLDYLELQVQRTLRLGASPLEFRSLENILPNAISTFVVQNAPANALIWDVTNPRQPAAMPHAGGRFLARTNMLREYVAFSPSSSFPTPRNFGRVAAQDLHALGTTQPVDLVIVTPPVFRQEAERLAVHRRNHDNLRTVVATTTQIYNEFGSGGQDITAIRDFVKMLYDRRGSAPGRMYVLLFGDASYDYKSDVAVSSSTDPNRRPGWWRDRQIRDGQNQNFVPTYESPESFDQVGVQPSYCSDDYFGFLDDDEGLWSEGGSFLHLMDAGIGRLPIRFPRNQPNSAAMARTVVDKLIAYDGSVAQGKWRNRLTFVADDGDGNEHVNNSETVATSLAVTQPRFQVGKVYLDAYPQVGTSSGQRSPDANAALDASIEQGSLLVSYAGHGGPTGWMNEQILTSTSVLRLQNRQRLTFMFTGTCDFAWYDDPGRDSAGELILTDTPAGVIGLLTTTRLVYSNNNQALAMAFYQSLFERDATTGRWPRLGDAVVYGKNNDGVDAPNRNFALLGDPSMRLAMPQLAARTTRLSDATDPNHTPVDTLRALQRVRLEGEVVDPVSTTLQSTFNGRVHVTVYEKPATVRTLGDENASVRSFQVQKDIVYDGQATVRNGRFSVDFVVPKDINYQFGLGKISLYAFDPSRNVDAHGANPGIMVGGASSTALNDTVPPTIRLAMDTEAFVFGGLTGPDSWLLASLRDASGINTAGTGIGHELTATLDNDPSKVTILNEHYTANVDSFTSGRVRYLFKNLTVGPHVLKVKAWDTFNNSAEREIEFIVASSDKLALKHILNYPNPFAAHTTFHFDHNRAGEDLDIQVQIFTVSGKLIRTLSAYVPASDPHVKSITWNGRDDYDDQLARGVYVYRINVRTPRDGSQVSKFEKLVLLN